MIKGLHGKRALGRCTTKPGPPPPFQATISSHLTYNLVKIHLETVIISNLIR